jgi:hypothetical protein
MGFRGLNIAWQFLWYTGGRGSFVCWGAVASRCSQLFGCARLTSAPPESAASYILGSDMRVPSRCVSD